jgi:hypothetical protein
MDVLYPTGLPADQEGPLARFLPPLWEGSTRRALREWGHEGDLVFDPFGSSPQFLLEAAQCGRAVLVAANNPVTRFVIQHTLRPFTQTDLQAALARLAATPKDGSRLELFLLDLYRTECARCGAEVIAESFIWDREVEGPSQKVYTCDRCGSTREASTTEEDRVQVAAYSRHGLQHALALEQVAPKGDPDRHHAEAALSVYPDRSLYALITLINKLGQMGLEGWMRSAVDALLLSAFDESNALWGYPEGRSRPRKLTASSRYREANVWRALERAVDTWAIGGEGVPITIWPSEVPPAPGTVAIFPGPVRELLPTLTEGQIDVLLTVLPRPNQAYWTLSALWSAWLWGRESIDPIRIALRRRRYDWSWHSGALRTVMAAIRPLLDVDTPVLAFVPEAEPGFIAAALAGFDTAGYQLQGRAFRLAERQAFLTWSKVDDVKAVSAADSFHEVMTDAAEKTLRSRGEPSQFPILHFAAWSELARERRISKLWDESGSPPITELSDALETALANRQIFTRLGRGVEPESGLYWLRDSTHVEVPLVDRVESLVLEILREKRALTLVDVDDYVCQALEGLNSPDQRFVLACVRSYATEDGVQGVWALRPEDEFDARDADCEEIRRLLVALGERMGYKAELGRRLIWRDQAGGQVFAFCVQESALLGSALEAVGDGGLTFVLPGGRAALVAEKARRDPRLRSWLQEGIGVVKFRHVRRLHAEIQLSQANIVERLAIDPPEQHDPQLPLL